MEFSRYRFTVYNILVEGWLKEWFLSLSFSKH